MALKTPLSLKINAHAKINLYLHLFGKRKDGYHALESLFLPLDLSDELVFQEANALSLKVKNQKSLTENISTENIILKAVGFFDHLFKTKSHFKISLNKKIPLAAGLGGGSADAAATFRFLFKYHGIDFNQGYFYQEIAKLGADIPACFHEKPCLGNGVGEVIQDFPAHMPKFYILLVNPGISVSTKNIFESLQLPVINEEAPKLNLNFTGVDFTFSTFLEFLRLFKNDLEFPATQNFPVIQDVLSVISRQQNCALSRLSGSGATCYGLFEKKAHAEKALKEILATKPDWWGHVTFSKKTT